MIFQRVLHDMYASVLLVHYLVIIVIILMWVCMIKYIFNFRSPRLFSRIFLIMSISLLPTFLTVFFSHLHTYSILLNILLAILIHHGRAIRVHKILP